MHGGVLPGAGVYFGEPPERLVCFPTKQEIGSPLEPAALGSQCYADGCLVSVWFLFEGTAPCAAFLNAPGIPSF